MTKLVVFLAVILALEVLAMIPSSPRLCQRVFMRGVSLLLGDEREGSHRLEQKLTRAFNKTCGGAKR